MRRIRNFSEYGKLLESYSSFGMEENDYEKAVLRIKRCCSKILQKGGMIGTALSAFPVAVSDQCQYLCTDGTVIIFNPKNVANLSDEETIWAVNQAVIHLALEHYDRKAGSDNTAWNLACDIAAEPFLEGVGDTLLPLRYSPSNTSAYLGKSAEEVYRMLLASPNLIQPGFFSYCEVLEPGEVDFDRISEVVIGDLNSIRGEEEEDQREEEEERTEKENQDKEDMDSDEKETEDGEDEDSEDGDDQDGDGEDEDGEDGDGQDGEDEDGEDGDDQDGDGEDEDGEDGEDGDGQDGDGEEPGKEGGTPGDDETEGGTPGKEPGKEGGTPGDDETEGGTPGKEPGKEGGTPGEEPGEEPGENDKPAEPGDIVKKGDKVRLKNGDIRVVKRVLPNGDIEI
jgi:segregation and condensation protein B